MERQVKNILLFIAFGILGLGIAIQVRTAEGLNKGSSVLYQMQKYQQQFEAAKNEGAALEKLIAQNQAKNQEYIKTMVPVRDLALEQEWESTKIKAGLTDVSGAGIVVTVSDAKVKVNEQLNLSLVHDIDLVKILNELKKGGAEALSINGERVTAITEVICMGPTIKINGRRYLSPFEIKAIGDADFLYDTLAASSIVASMKEATISFDMQKKANITINAYNMPIKREVSAAGGAK